VNKATPMLATFLDAELKRRNLPPSALALVGFSQGTMMALHVGLRRAAAPFAIVGYSGLLAVPPDVNPEKFAAEIKSRPPVLRVSAAGATAGTPPRRRRCSTLRAGSPRSASRSNGTCPTASATASIRTDCATAVSFSPAAWQRRADAAIAHERDLEPRDGCWT